MDCEICSYEVGSIKGLVNHLRMHKVFVKDYYDRYVKGGVLSKFC